MESFKNKFPDDVIMALLSKVSVKTILRFRCVCKVWCDIIKSDDFVTMHFNNPTNESDYRVLIKRCLEDRVTNMLSVHSSSELLKIVSPDVQIPHFDNESVQCLGPCNGLVCFSDYKTVVLCNPAIREFTLLPERPFGCPQDMHCNYRGVGFGFDEKTNDFKVIKIVELEDEDDYNVQSLNAELYQYSTDSWRVIYYNIPKIWNEDCFETLYNGATHWHASGDVQEKILSFNFATDMFLEFDYPEGRQQPEDAKRPCLTVLNEFLVLLSYTDPWDRTHQQFIDVWVMIEYGFSDSWAKQFTIGPLSEISHPITSWKNSALLLEKTNGQLVSCDLDSQEVKEFDITSFPNTLRALVCKESLVSIKRVNNQLLDNENTLAS